MPVLTDEDVGLAPAKTLSDADVGLALSDADVGINTSEPYLSTDIAPPQPPPSFEQQGRRDFMAKQQAELRQADAGGAAIQAVTHAEGVAGALENPIGAVLALPENALKAAGVNMPYTAKAPLISREQALKAIEFITPGGGGSEGSMTQSMQEFIAETLSTLTSPDMIGYMLAAKKAPLPVGRYFQGEMLAQLPATAAAAAETDSGSEKTKAALAVAANVAFPAMIESGITKDATKIKGEVAKQVGPVTEATVKGTTEAPKASVPSEPAPALAQRATALEAVPAEIEPKPVVQPAPPKGVTSGLGIVQDAKLVELVEPLAQKTFWQKWFTAAGNLPKEVFSQWQERGGRVSAETRKAAYAARDLEGALRDEFSISSAQFLTRGIADVPKETIQQINDVLQNKADPALLPPKVREPVMKLREHVDSLSDEVIGVLKAEGNEKLAATIEENKGVYLTRSYRIFDDPKYAKGISESQLGPVREQIARDLQETAAERGEARPVESFYPQAEVNLRELIADWSDKGLDKLFRQGKLGSKDLSLFMRRKDISPEMRALMGEYKDPIVNYVRSVTKISRFLGDQKFLNEVRATGLDKFLFEEGKAPAGFEHKLAADESSVMAPLNGLRTSKPIKDAFEQFGKSTVPDGVFWKMWFGLTAAAKSAKTVLSFLTQMRNLIGNPAFNVFSGHFNFKDYHKAVLSQFADIAGNAKKWQEYYLDLVRHRLVDESAPARELRDSLMDAGLRDPENINFDSAGLKRAGRQVLRAPFRGYRMADEMGKTVGWEAEKATLRKAHPEWDEVKVKQEAADRVRNTYPTYSMVPEWVRQFRRQPLFGPFMTFAYEMMRTQYHGWRYAAQDLNSGNPALVSAGSKRLAGMMAVYGSGAALGALSRYAIGLSKDTEDDVRRFLPEWSDNAQLVFFAHDGTKVGYLNWSYLNPYSYSVDPFVAIFENNDEALFQKSVSAFGELLRPFTSEQMLAAAMTDVARNKTDRGKEVFNPQDSPDVKWRKATAHLATAIEPGSLYRLRNRIIPSFREDTPGLGRKLEPATEITAELTGLRLEQFDFKDAVKFKTLAFARDERDAERIFKTEVLRGDASMATVLTAYRNMEESRFKLWKRFYGDTAAARRQGVEDDEIEGALRASALSKSDRAALLEGIYRPRKFTPELQRWLEENKRPVPTNEIDALRSELETRSLIEQ